MFFLSKNFILLSKSIKILKICTFFHHATHTKIYYIEYQAISHERRGVYSARDILTTEGHGTTRKHDTYYILALWAEKIVRPKGDKKSKLSKPCVSAGMY